MIKHQTEIAPPEEPSDSCGVYFVDDAKVDAARTTLLPDTLVEDAVDLFRVLGHRNRIAILRALGAEELCVCDLAQLLSMSVSAVSHQLSDLRRMRLVSHRSEGKLVYYSLRDRLPLELLDLVLARREASP